MQIASNPISSASAGAVTHRASDVAGTTAASPLAHYQIIRRNGAVVPFEPSKIAIALMKAFLAVHGTQGAASASVRETVDGLTQSVIRALVRSRPGGGTFHIEDAAVTMKSPAPMCCTAKSAPRNVPIRSSSTRRRRPCCTCWRAARRSSSIWTM